MTHNSPITYKLKLTTAPDLEQGLDGGLEDERVVEQEGPEQRLRVARQARHQARQQQVHVQRVLHHRLQLAQQRRQERACGGMDT